MSGETDPEKLGDPTSEQESRLIGYLSGTLTPDEAMQFEQEVLEDRALAGALYRAVNLEAGMETLRAEIPSDSTEPFDLSERTMGRASQPSGAVEPLRRPVRPERWTPWLRTRWVIPTAAVSFVVLIIVLTRGPETSTDDSATRFRGDEATLHVIAPLGEIQSGPDRFLWNSIEGAVLYRFELYDASMRMIHQTALAETTLSVPFDVASAPAEGAWQVAALGAEGTPIGVSSIARYSALQRPR